MALATIGFVVCSWAGSKLAIRSGRAGRLLVRLLLLGDALAAVGLSLGVGGPRSPLRYLVILQVVEATLLASFRTGLKVAAWQSLVISSLYVVGPIVAPGLATTHLAGGNATDVRALVAGAWIAAITTAWLAAANERELRRRRYDLEQLARFHDELDDVTVAEDAAQMFATLVADEFDAPRLLVLMPLAPDSPTLQVVATYGVDHALERVVVTPGSLLAEASSSIATLLVSGIDPTLDAPLDTVLAGAENLAILPVRTQRGRGVAIVEHGARAGTRMEQRIVSMIERYRDELSSRLSTLWLIDSLREAAERDALTGLANRARLLDELHAATQRASRQSDPLCVAMIDVDHFKAVNDSHGHSAGDAVLRKVAEALRTTVRPYDLVARYGGEEFVVILPGTTLAAALPIAERMRAAVPSRTAPRPATISLGIAQFDPAQDDVEGLLRRADEALYQAKGRGRDRVVVARPHRATIGP
jgi:two-component system, cell cycle response regulator